MDTLIYPLSFVFRILGNAFIDFKSTIFYDETTGVDERGYIQFQYDEAVANISYGMGHSYRNEILVWTENAILKADRVFSRPKTCENPVEIISNGNDQKYWLSRADHFSIMLSAFVEDITFGRSNSEGTLNRLRFIDELQKG